MVDEPGEGGEGEARPALRPEDVRFAFHMTGDEGEELPVPDMDPEDGGHPT